jgi:NAD(P)-dependent dehydrogenase (short-subunit alcohol dehydrogenase family)
MHSDRPWALITGAKGGIGRALVQCFSTNGFNVLATDIVKENPFNSTSVVFLQLDLSEFVASEIYANDVVSKIGLLTEGKGISALINNAATQILGNCEEISRDDWHNSFNVNVTAPFFLIQSFLPQLMANKGAVVNISSIHATQTKSGFVTYATTKSALSAMTRNLAVDLADKVRINAIEPAAISTKMLKAGFEGKEEQFQLLESFHPLARIGTPEEVAEIALFLCAEKSSFIHGACISATGGIQGCLSDPK